MKKTLILLIYLQLISFSSEKKEVSHYTIDNIEDVDTNGNDVLIHTDSLIIESDSTEQTQATVDSTITKKKISKNKYPKREFITNTGEEDSVYLAYEWAITFFVKNGQKEELDQFKKIGFPMEWWASGMCSYYPVSLDSVSYFLKRAREIGYQDYGFDCEKVANTEFSAALSNSIEVRINPGQNVDAIIKDYGLELKQEYNNQLYALRTINRNAKELIKTVDLLNKDERINRASYTFRRCD